MYIIDWDDGNIYETEYCPNGTPYEACHKWEKIDTYYIRAKAKDTLGAESDWSKIFIEISRNKATINLPVLGFLERFPLLERLLSLLK